MTPEPSTVAISPEIEYEQQLQSWLASTPEALETGLWIIGYEFPIGANFADLLAVDRMGRLAVIEVKRANATREAVGQALDYASALDLMDDSEIARIVETQAARPEFPQMIDFARERAARFPGGAPPPLTPTRVLLAATSESDGTARILSYLRERGVEIESVVFEGAFTPKGTRAYQRQRTSRASDRTSSGALGRSVAGDYRRAPAPCKTEFPKASTKKRDEIDEVHQRAATYPGADLFREIHCSLVHAFPKAHEVARAEHDSSRRLSCGIGVNMPATAADPQHGRLDYFSLRLYPDDRPGHVRLQFFDGAVRRVGTAEHVLEGLPDFDPVGGRNRGAIDGCDVWFTEATWLAHRQQLEEVLQVINETWETERQAGGFQ